MVKCNDQICIYNYICIIYMYNLLLMVKNPPANVGDAGSAPGSGRSFGGINGNPLQYSCLENCMGKGAWWAIVHGISTSRTQLIMHTHT